MHKNWNQVDLRMERTFGKAGYPQLPTPATSTQRGGGVPAPKVKWCLIAAYHVRYAFALGFLCNVRNGTMI